MANNALTISTIDGSDALVFTGAITGNGNVPLTVSNATGNVSINGSLSGAGTSLIATGPMTLNLNGALTYGGATTVNGERSY